MMVDKQTEGNVDRRLIFCEFILDLGLPKSNLSGGLHELRG